MMMGSAAFFLKKKILCTKHLIFLKNMDFFELKVNSDMIVALITSPKEAKGLESNWVAGDSC